MENGIVGWSAGRMEQEADRLKSKISEEFEEMDSLVDPLDSQTRYNLLELMDVGIDRIKLLRGGRATSLEKEGVASVGQLLLHFPRRYIDRSKIVPLNALPIGVEVTVVGTVVTVSSRRARRGMTIVEAVVSDQTGSVKAVWFNQGFRARQLRKGMEVAFFGKVERYRGRLQMNSPVVDVLSTSREALETGRVVPIYSTVGGVTSGFLRRAIHNVLKKARPLSDPLPPQIIRRHRLLSRERALFQIHFPETPQERYMARRRLVFDEFFRLEIALAMAKYQNQAQQTGISHFPSQDLAKQFISGLPYPLTGSQQRVIKEIQDDMAKPYAMHRLLQGEVGSGKTVVAVASVLTGVAGGYQTAVMAPTEVLAEQHFRGISQLISDAGMAPQPEAPDLFTEGSKRSASQLVRVGLLTGEASETNFHPQGSVSRAKLLKLVAAGEVDILIGTHALISEGVEFENLGVAVIDEQHRFGVEQRLRLREKAGEQSPDLLIMTATPIPRTLAMTLYGDLDVSILDEMPPGRSPITTWTVPASESGLNRAYKEIRQQVSEGRQVYVVCPLVQDSDKSPSVSVQTEYRRLRKALPDLRIGLIHGQLRLPEKDKVMGEFRNGDLDVLVATTVIEVGIDVPNATLMVILNADRFGLSQLHQLRGRVGRGKHKSHCILVADPTTEEGEARVQAMVDSNDGFVIAEKDLEIRKSGTVFGDRQSGFTDLKIANLIKDREALVAARSDAFDLVWEHPGLDPYPNLKQEVRRMLGDDVEWLFAS